MGCRARSDRPRPPGITRRAPRPGSTSRWLATAAIALAVAAWPAACRIDELIDPEPPSGASGPIAPDGVARLTFTVGPRSVPAGAALDPPIAVAALDEDGNIVAAFDGVITIAIEEHPNEATLAGGTARPAVDGVAVFPDLAVSRPGEDYRLFALAQGVPAVRSDAFDVLPPPGVPARLTRRGGHEQTDSVGRQLAAPYVVRVTDAYDTPLPGVTVLWEIEDGGGSVAPSVTTTDPVGEARTFHSLGTAAGEQRVRARIADNPDIDVRFTAIAIHTAPHALLFTVQPSTAEQDRRIEPPVEVTIVDRFGNPATRAREEITMSLVPFAGTLFARLHGKLDERIEDGVARFRDLRVSRVGTGYRLRARFGTLIADSEPFTIVER